MATTAITETFDDVQNLMFQYAHKFHKQYGGDWDEWVSEGQEIFMKAYTRYEPTKGSFVTWFAFFLQKLFMEKVRRQTMRNVRHRKVDMDLYLYVKPRKAFDLEELGRDLSDDARMVVQLMLETPNDLKLCFAEQKKNIRFRDRILNGLIQFLSDIGWQQDRVFDAFDEVSQALC